MQSYNSFSSINKFRTMQSFKLLEEANCYQGQARVC
uniref:Uncharacterized protein n=1 Tax=Rhizophora mucronata TaxID=61149 RepID=A0A2P2PSV6_RHIMU